MIFYNFCYYFWSQHCWWTETNTIDNDFFVCFKFPFLSTASLLPLSYRCSGVPKYACCCVNKLHLNGVCKREYDVILWRHKQHISSNNRHHTPLLNTSIW